MAIEVTRKEIFAQIWDRPMTKVAAEYGISDVALKKICDKHRIPVPGRGYWAKKAAGKPVKKGHFREVSDPLVERIIIHGSGLQNLPESVKAARTAARQREKRDESRIEVPPTPAELDPKVARTVARIERAKPDGRGLVTVRGPEFFNVEVGPSSTGRVAALLNALVAASAERGFKVSKGGGALVFVVDDEPIDVKITEEIRRTKHVPTDAEVAALRKWEDRQQRSVRYGQLDWTPRPAPPEWDHSPSGALRVHLNEGRFGHDGLRRSFGDGKIQRLENLINAILEAFTVWSAAIKAKRIKDERRQREWREAEKRREEERRMAVLEKKRVEVLHRHLERRRLRRDVLDYVAAVETKLGEREYDDTEAITAWIAWAKGYSDRLDPLREGLPKLPEFEDFSPWG